MSEEQSIRGYHALTKNLEGKGSSLLFNRVEQTDSASLYQIYHEALVRWMRNRRFFVTKSGYIGRGSKIMQRGDLVTVLYGSRVPIILRQLRQTESYAVVGQAYVYGIMFGEVVEAHKKVGAKDRTFMLL